MKTFFAYEKMPDNFKKMKLSESDINLLNRVDWIVTEKIHGANFSFTYHQHKLGFAKRKEPLLFSDDFFGFQIVVKEMEDKLLSFFESLSTQIGDGKFTLYGELFGGKYPHPEVETSEQLQAIQTGVYYSPDIRFCAFDIAVEPTSNGKRYYLDYAQAITYFQEFDIFYALPLFKGKLNKALEYNTRVNSIIPSQLNLPELDNNLIEGVVIKPTENMITEAGFRPILKIKNEEFNEQDKFHQAQKWSYLPDITTNSEELGFLMEDLRAYVNINRLMSASSKIGKINAEDNERLMAIKQELLLDIIKDFNENNNDILKDINEEQEEWLKKRLMVKADQLVAQYLTQNNPGG